MKKKYHLVEYLKEGEQSLHIQRIINLRKNHRRIFFQRRKWSLHESVSRERRPWGDKVILNGWLRVMKSLSSKLLIYGKIQKYNLDLKDYLEIMEKSNEELKFKIVNFRNSTIICETYVSMKKKITILHEILSKFTKEK